jgi:hypothetical protein
VSEIPKVINAYIVLRDKIAEETARSKAVLAELAKKQLVLEGYLDRQLTELGVQNIKTEYGTVFKYSKDTVSVQNRADFLDFVLAQIAEHGADGLGFMTVAANKEMVKQFMQENEDSLPPGIKYDQWKAVKVERAKAEAPKRKSTKEKVNE